MKNNVLCSCFFHILSVLFSLIFIDEIQVRTNPGQGTCALGSLDTDVGNLGSGDHGNL